MYNYDSKCVRGYCQYGGVLLILKFHHSTFASSAPSVAVTRIVADFGVSSEVSYLVTSVFLLGYMLGVRFHPFPLDVSVTNPCICLATVLGPRE